VSGCWVGGFALLRVERSAARLVAWKVGTVVPLHTSQHAPIHPVTSLNHTNMKGRAAGRRGGIGSSAGGGGSGGGAAEEGLWGSGSGAAAAAALPIPEGDDEGGGFGDIDLPEGINVEEARMLEAAMLGIPYTGRMPQFGAASAVPVDPSVLGQRNLRREQDAAFEESLAADRWAVGGWEVGWVWCWVGGRLGGWVFPQLFVFVGSTSPSAP